MQPPILSDVREALLAAGITGPHQSHSRSNAISKIHAIISEEDTDDTFGLSGLDRYAAAEILSFVAELTGCSDDIADRDGYDTISPDLTVQGLLTAARFLRDHARRGSVLFAGTGHPTGMLEHHIRVVDAYVAAGGKVLRLREDENLMTPRGRHLEVRYVGNVGCLADWGALRHTHSAWAMEQLLESEPWPDVVLADHGFAGAALERNIPTVAVMDINDPALAVAWADKRPIRVIPMDDNRPPRLYRPAWEFLEAVISGAVDG